MKIRLLLLSITLFSFIGSTNAQVTISQCATPGSIQASANCQVALPDFTSQIIAEDPINLDPISVSQVPTPGTMVSPGDITLTFSAFSNFGADTCMAVLTVTANPTTCGTYVPDDNFEQALIDLGYDTAPLNNFVPTENIAALTTLDVSNKNIADLTGIEAFVVLTQLDVNDNQLTSLDVSNNTALQTLNCHNNTAIEYLDLRNNTALTNLRCDNVGLRSLDFRNGNNTNVVSFQADNNNMRCIAIDDQFGAYTASWIKDGSTRYYRTVCEIYIPDDNFEQAFIDLRFDFGTPDNFVSVFPLDTLRKLNMSNRNINDLTGAADFASMEDFNISNNNITEFDFRYNTKLKKLDASSNALTSINITESPLLEELSVDDNQLTSLDISTNTALTQLSGNDNQLTSLDVSNNVALLIINANNNDISNIDVSSNSSLEILNLAQNNLTNASDLVLGTNTNFSDLDVSGNNLETLDVSGVPNMNELICSNNNLTEIDVNGFPLLELIYAENNNLTELDVSTNPVLGLLRVQNNDLTYLNTKNGSIDFRVFNATGNPNLICIEVDDATAANAGTGRYTNWQKDAIATYSASCRTYVPDDNFEQALIDLGYDSGALDDYVPTANIDGLTELSVRYNNIVDLTGIEDFVSLITLRCDNNDITSLDVSNNQTLTDLRCHDNPLGTLDLSANTLLTRVDAFRTELTNINLTGLTQLAVLKVSENLFSSIDLSTNTGLIELTISENSALTSLDVSTHTELVKLYAYECQLGSLDLSTNTKIEVVNVQDNLLITLDVSANTVLESLNAEDNQLTSINLSANTGLRLLYLDDNQLTSLDLSNNTNLTRLECENNKLVSLNVKNGSSASISTLRSTSNFDLNCIEVDDPVAATAGTGNYSGWLKDDSTAYADGCVPFTYVPDDNFEQTLIDLALDDVLDNFVVTSNISGITILDLNTQSIADVTGIEDFTALITLNVNDNQITRLDLKQNTALTSIQANNNQLQFFSVKNGNNANVTTFSVTGNADLLCIEVDDETASYLSAWQKDATASFGTICTACTVDGTEIATQAELDLFVAYLGSCNTVNGNLTIRRSKDITDLSGLSSIEVINGKLFIGDNELITTLDGLENLTTVTDGINLSRNDILSDISALSGIVNPTVSITISDNTVLTDITAVLDLTITELIFINGQTLSHALTFSNVTTLTGSNSFNLSGPGSLNLRNVETPSVSFPNLTTIENFFNLRDIAINTVSFPLLTSVGRSFTIDGAENTTTFDFNVLQTVNGFTFEETSVSDLSSFASLTSAGTFISIGDHPNLMILDALGNISSTTNTYLYVRNNNALTSLDGLEFISGSNEIIWIENNPMLTQIDALQNVTSVGYFQILDNTQLANVNGLNNLTETTETGTASYQQSTISGNAISTLNLTSLRTVGNQLNIVETGVTNFCGLYSYVADGDGQTSLNLTGSSFTIADILTCEDVFSCPLYSLPSDNFKIQTFSETCSGKNNGIIAIEATEALSYIATIDGNTYDFTSTQEITDMPPGKYTMCIAIDGITDCEQCFEVNINGAEKLTGKTTVSSNEMFVAVETGTAPYTVMINGKEAASYTTNSFSVAVQHGDTVEVFSSLDCEGKLSTKVDLFDEITISPNPTQGDVTLMIPNTLLKTINVDIHNTLGVMVSSREYSITSEQVLLSMVELPRGIYFISIDQGATFKIVKQ